MKINSKEKNLIIDSLLKKFADYSIITYDYIANFVKAFEDEDKSYDGFNLEIDFCPTDVNQYLYVIFKIQSFIYNKLCMMSLDDADILLALVNEKMRVVNMVARRFNFTDEQKKENYLIDALTMFDGTESIDTHITRYVIAQIKGVPFKTKKEEEEKIRLQNVQEQAKQEALIQSKKEKKKNKKNKNVVLNKVSSLEDLGKVNEEPISNKVITTEQVPKEETVLELYLKKCNKAKGSKEKDEFVETFLNLGTYDLIDYANNKDYAMYILLRFGLINDTFYNITEIAQISDIDIRTILGFEKFTVEVMRLHINEKIDNYLKLLIS